jgi:PAS domain S-box-containing protein
MEMHIGQKLMATAIQQIESIAQIAISSAPSNAEIVNQDLNNLNLTDKLELLQDHLLQLEAWQRSQQGILDSYQDLFEFAPDGYFVTDANGDISAANRAAMLMFGSHPIGKNLENFVYPSYKEQFQRLIGQLQRGQNIKSLDFRMQFPTGQPYEASFTIISMRSPDDGRVLGMRWWIQDITQRRQDADKLQHSHQRLEIRIAEMNAKLNLMDRQIRVEREEQRRISRNLTRNEAKLRAIMQHSSDIVNILDIDTTIQYCSPAIFQNLGYMPDDLIGKKLVKFIHKDDLPIFQDFLSHTVDTVALSTPIVMRYQHINGNWVYLESVCCNLLQDSNVQGLVINSRNITERKRTESALKESELRIATIASSMPATLYRLAINHDGKMSLPFISDGLVDLVGISPRQAIANPYQILDLIHPEDVDQFKALIKAGFDKLATFRHEFRVISTSGNIKWAQNITRYYQTDTGQIIADGVCIDISERGEAEVNLQQTNELLRAIIKSVPVAIDIIAPDGKVLLWNAAASDLFGWDQIAEINHIAPTVPESQELQAALLDTLAGKPLKDVLLPMQLNNGQRLNINISTVLVHDLNDKIIGVLRIIDNLAHKLDQNPHQLANQITKMAIDGRSDRSALLLINKYKIGHRNFAGLRLRGADLVEAELPQIDLRGAELNGSNCSHANFQSANLRGADLRGVNFQAANLQWADLVGADLRGADLDHANLKNANIEGATFDKG